MKRRDFGKLALSATVAGALPSAASPQLPLQEVNERILIEIGAGWISRVQLTDRVPAAFQSLRNRVWRRYQMHLPNCLIKDNLDFDREMFRISYKGNLLRVGYKQPDCYLLWNEDYEAKIDFPAYEFESDFGSQNFWVPYAQRSEAREAGLRHISWAFFLAGEAAAATNPSRIREARAFNTGKATLI